MASCRAQPAVTLAFLGDINLGRDVHPSATSFDVILPDLQSVDLALANLESPLALFPPENAGQGYNLCAPIPDGSLLSGWGLDMLSIANNHTFDCGSFGLIETATILNEDGITPLGLGTKPVYREVNSIPLAFLAFEDVTTRLDGEAAAGQIWSARETGALVVVSVHWGAEYQGGASQRQKELARRFAEAGASIIWGHHPHVLQPAEWIDTSWGRTLVLYSLGNALFDQGGLDDTRQSALVLVRLNMRRVTSARAVPFEIDIHDSRLVQLGADTAQAVVDRLQLP